MASQPVTHAELEEALATLRKELSGRIDASRDLLVQNTKLRIRLMELTVSNVTASVSHVLDLLERQR